MANKPATASAIQSTLGNHINRIDITTMIATKIGRTLLGKDIAHGNLNNSIKHDVMSINYAHETSRENKRTETKVMEHLGQNKQHIISIITLVQWKVHFS